MSKETDFPLSLNKKGIKKLSDNKAEDQALRVSGHLLFEFFGEEIIAELDKRAAQNGKGIATG